MFKLTIQPLAICLLLLVSACAEKPSVAKQRLEEAFKQFPSAGLGTLLIKKLYIDAKTMSPEVIVRKYDFTNQQAFLSVDRIGTQNRGVIQEVVQLNQQGREQVYSYYYDKMYQYPADFNAGKADSPLWNKNITNVSDVKILDTVTLEGTKLTIVQYTSRYGIGVVLLDAKNRFRGYANYNLSTKEYSYYQMCSTTKVGAYTLYDACHGYDQNLELVDSSRLISATINPKFDFKDWQLSKTLKTKEVDGSNPFGFTPIPADEFNLTGLRVVPPVLRGAALKAGLSIGDEIISINGKNVTKMVFSEAEAIFWGTKKLKLTIKTKKGATKTVNLAIK